MSATFGKQAGLTFRSYSPRFPYLGTTGMGATVCFPGLCLDALEHASGIPKCRPPRHAPFVDSRSTPGCPGCWIGRGDHMGSAVERRGCNLICRTRTFWPRGGAWKSDSRLNGRSTKADQAGQTNIFASQQGEAPAYRSQAHQAAVSYNSPGSRPGAGVVQMP